MEIQEYIKTIDNKIEDLNIEKESILLLQDLTNLKEYVTMDIEYKNRVRQFFKRIRETKE